MKKLKRISPLLINCNPLLVCPPLAVRLGLVQSLLLQQVHYWLCLNRENECEREEPKHYKNGRWWCYNSIENWQKNNFPFLSKDTIKRGFHKLESLGLVVTANYNRKAYDRTKWYSIDYDAVLKLFPDSFGLMIHPETNQIMEKKVDDEISKPREGVDYDEMNNPYEGLDYNIVNSILGISPDCSGDSDSSEHNINSFESSVVL